MGTGALPIQHCWGSCGFLPGVGIIGAIIANTSGTGGGVVFVPVFNALRELGVMSLSPLAVVGVYDGGSRASA